MTEWSSEPLTNWHDVSSFDSGKPSLDEWLRTTALRAQKADTARTFVWTRGDEKVVAYYSIAPTQVRRGEVPRQVTGGFNVVPAYLLARLALDVSNQGQGLGAELLVDALEQIVDAATRGGGRLIIVDAIDEAAAGFYRHHEFRPVGSDSARLYMKVATARQALGLGTVSIAASDETQLVSFEFLLPDGGTRSVVMSPAEAREVARRIGAAATPSVAAEPATISVPKILHEVLGRDPFLL